jgi:hypothetical protein
MSIAFFVFVSLLFISAAVGGRQQVSQQGGCSLFLVRQLLDDSIAPHSIYPPGAPAPPTTILTGLHILLHLHAVLLQLFDFNGTARKNKQLASYYFKSNSSILIDDLKLVS